MRAAIIACIFTIATTGCTTTSGVQVQQSQLSSFRKGITTEAEVISTLGTPTMSSLTSDGERVLVYSFAEYKIRGATFIPIVGLLAGGSDMSTNSAVVTFGKDGKMVSYTTTESKINSGTGATSVPPDPARH
jgi:outer membrane protein assembly factor BamE (lipoprotein component of BamABCDE complex)